MTKYNKVLTFQSTRMRRAAAYLQRSAPYDGSCSATLSRNYWKYLREGSTSVLLLLFFCRYPDGCATDWTNIPSASIATPVNRSVILASGD